MYQKGYITKEAALRILKHRSELIKKATVDCTNEVFGFQKKGALNLFSFGKGETPKGKPSGAPKGGGGPVKMLPSMKNILPLLGLAGLIAAGTTVAKVGLGAVGDIRTRSKIDESYQQMFVEFPELAENKQQATKYFNMMAKFAPILAANPIVAGTWVKGTMDANVVAPQNIQQLMEAQNEWEEMRSMRSPFSAFTQEVPQTKTLLERSVILGDMAS